MHGGPVGDLIGRDSELATVARTIASGRVVTITGPAGVGKTTLARAVGGREACFAALRVAADRDGVGVEVARAAEAPVGEDPVGAAAHALDGRLIVLDNCEHVLGAAAEVAARLAASGAPVLATSRSALGTDGEIVITLSPLAPADAANLYVQRAGSTSTEGIAELCRRLDHLPLALELAAGWASVLSPVELAARLDDRFTMLDEGGEQRSLRAAVSTSWDLIAESDRVALAALSVFVGPFSPASAEAVAGADVLPALRRLARASLVQVDQREASTRYVLLETIRDFAREQLRELGGEDVVRDRHLAHFARLTEEAEAGAAIGDVSRLAAHVPDLIAALQWGLVESPGVAGAHLAVLVRPVWQFLGLVREGRLWLTRAKAIDLEPSDRARVLNALANFCLMAGDMGEAEPLYQEALALRRAIGKPLPVAHNLMDLGVLQLHRGQLTTSRMTLEEALALLEAGGDGSGVAACLINLGNIEVLDGDALRAHERFTQARAALLGSAEQFLLAAVELNLAVAALGTGRLSEAADHLAAGLPVMHEGGHRVEVLAGIEAAAALAERSGRAEDAVWILAATDELRRSWGVPPSPSETADLAMLVTRARVAAGSKAAASAQAEGRAADEAAVVARALQVTASPPALRRRGEVWEVTFAARSVSVPDAKGMGDLAVLLANPGVEIDALALASPDPTAIGVQGDAGPVLDHAARRAYSARILELRTALDEADRRGDAESSAAASDELAALSRELGSATGVGGRARIVGSAGERARKAVTKRVRAEIAKLARLHPELGAHLESAVITGGRCSYRPDPSLRWDVTA